VDFLAFGRAGGCRLDLPANRVAHQHVTHGFSGLQLDFAELEGRANDGRLRLAVEVNDLAVRPPRHHRGRALPLSGKSGSPRFVAAEALLIGRNGDIEGERAQQQGCRTHARVHFLEVQHYSYSASVSQSWAVQSKSSR